jgi:hypothetical protein
MSRRLFLAPLLVVLSMLCGSSPSVLALAQEATPAAQVRLAWAPCVDDCGPKR